MAHAARALPHAAAPGPHSRALGLGHRHCLGPLGDLDLGLRPTSYHAQRERSAVLFEFLYGRLHRLPSKGPIVDPDKLIPGPASDHLQRRGSGWGEKAHDRDAVGPRAAVHDPQGVVVIRSREAPPRLNSRDRRSVGLALYLAAVDDEHREEDDRESEYNGDRMKLNLHCLLLSGRTRSRWRPVRRLQRCSEEGFFQAVDSPLGPASRNVGAPPNGRVWRSSLAVGESALP